jgi:hypothetical protein
MSEQDQQLPGLLARWRELTEQEATAIRSGLWSEVDRHQRDKRALQLTISQSSPAARSAPQLRAAVSELMALERENAELLGERIGQARRLRAESEQSCRNLRRVRQSYGAVAQTHWQSYS